MDGTLKQLLAFPMYVTAAWLVFVLASRAAPKPWQWLLAAIGLAFAAWAWMRAQQGGATAGWRRRCWPDRDGWAAGHAAWLAETGSRRPPWPARNGIASVAFSEQALADLRAQGRVVLVNMTADWCVSCKVNERPCSPATVSARRWTPPMRCT